MSPMKRLRRWRDFRRRVDFAPNNVYRHETRGWEYIPIHPFSDEIEILSSRSIDPSECWSVDAWWGIDGDATLVESWIAERAHCPPGLYVKPVAHAEEWSYLFAVIDAPAITRLAFEAAMSRFADAGFPSSLRVEPGAPWLTLDS
ncbi:hypothetical protein NA78x_004789 [Anatilimnocola sp. NA78]|uniref:hypothetical protein n=1 Tax=Anatilimnocola sp. NA78 TaxID=3415683 RepID=UPI003CE49BE5